MKKFLLYIILILPVITLFTPTIAYGAVMELNITITSFQIPERAAITFQAGYPNTEFNEDGGYSRITVAEHNNITAILATKEFINSSAGKLIKGTVLIISFPYSDLKTYDVYTEIKAVVGQTIACKANCTPVPIGTYTTYWTPGVGGLQVSCSTNICINGSNTGQIAFTSTYVFKYDSAGTTITPSGTNYWWRSPTIYKINYE